MCITTTTVLAQEGNVSPNADSSSSDNSNIQDIRIGSKGTSYFGVNIQYFIPQHDADKAYGLDYNILLGRYLADNVSLDGGLSLYTGDVRYSYIQLSSTSLTIPINIGYRIPLTHTGYTGLHFYTGPKFGLVVGGKYKIGDEVHRLSEFEDLKRFNAYWSFGINFEIYAVGIHAQYMVLLGKKTDFSSGAFGIGISLRL